MCDIHKVRTCMVCAGEWHRTIYTNSITTERKKTEEPIEKVYRYIGIQWRGETQSDNDNKRIAYMYLYIDRDRNSARKVRGRLTLGLGRRRLAGRPIRPDASAAEPLSVHGADGALRFLKQIERRWDQNWPYSSG